MTSHDSRRRRLAELIDEKRCLRVIEVHNPISAIIAENASVPTGNAGQQVQFDAFWSSSLTDSTMRGLPDIEVLDARARLANIDDIFSVTTKPLIMDGDTGGHPEHFEFSVRDMERRGVSAVIIEDKAGLKRNSLLAGHGHHVLATIDEFCEKIRRGKAAQATDEFRIFARIEALILDQGIAEALKRADAYVAAGADGIMIHSRQSKPDEILEFAAQFRQDHPATPMIAVPTTYNLVHAQELADAGFNIVIYANHMLRASLKAMQEVSRTILEHGRSAEAEHLCLDIEGVLRMHSLRPNPRRVPVEATA